MLYDAALRHVGYQVGGQLAARAGYPTSRPAAVFQVVGER